MSNDCMECDYLQYDNSMLYDRIEHLSKENAELKQKIMDFQQGLEKAGFGPASSIEIQLDNLV